MNRLLKYTLAAAAAPVAIMAASTQAQEFVNGFLCQDGACVDKRFSNDPCQPQADQTENGEVRFMRDRPQDRTVSISEDGTRSMYLSQTTLFPEHNPFLAGEDPTGTSEHPEAPLNLLPTIYKNALDCGGDEIPNTLPSTPENPFNLMTDPVVTEINPTSREQDLDLIITRLEEATDQDLRDRKLTTVYPEGKRIPADPRIGGAERFAPDAGRIEDNIATSLNLDEIELAIDILEGEPVPNRVYSGFAVLNYTGPEKVTPVVCDETECVAEVHQIWGRQSILSDTMFFDIPDEALMREWKVRYTVDVIDRGHEDFAPFVVYFDDPLDVGGPGRNGVALDATFFPMDIGKRYEFDLMMAPARYFNLTYHWGWRVHSPRIQAIENGRKAPGGKNIIEWENEVFCAELDDQGNCTVFPRDNEEAKLKAISMIGEMAPAKRMWTAFRKLRVFAQGSTDDTGDDVDGSGSSEENNDNIRALVEELRASFDDWSDRTELPRGFTQDPDADLTMVYVNNTMYGHFKDQKRDLAQERFLKWETRGTKLTVQLINGDYFPHQYMNVDFGGARGWENIYQPTFPIGGQGSLFSFGRAYWFQNMPCPAPVAAAQPQAHNGNPFRTLGPLPQSSEEATLRAMQEDNIFSPELQFCPGLAGTVKPAFTPEGFGYHTVEIDYRYEPSRRLRFYQFDPTHHNVQIWSVH